jgi:integrase/recombinase XerC
MPGLTRDDAVLVREHLRYLQLLGRSESTVYARSRALIRLGLAIRPVRLAYAGVPELYAWRQQLAVGDGSVQSYVTHVREFYAWLQAQDVRDDNPALALPVPPRPRMLPRPVSSEDLAYALATAPARIRPWLVLAAWCGLRAKEIALLRRESVLDAAEPPALIVAIDATKGRRAERMIPLHPFALAELQRLPLPRSGWVFPRRDGRPGPNQPWRVSHLCNDHLHSLGIAASVHQLRHWFGTETYRASRDLRVVQELLGHASPQTTAGYAAISREGTAAAVAALPVPPAKLRCIGGGDKT